MQYLYSFFYTLYFSSTAVKKYSTLLKHSGKYILAYFFFWLICFTGVATLQFIYFQAPQYISVVTDSIKELQSSYPADLVLTWDGKTLQSSKEPIIVSYPSAIVPDKLQIPPHLAYISSQTTFEQIPEVERYLFVVSPTELKVQDAAGNWNTHAVNTLLPNDSTITITHEGITQSSLLAIQAITDRATSIQIAMGGIYFIWLVFTIVLTTIFRSIPVFILLKIADSKTTIQKSLKLTALLVTPAIGVQTLAQFLYPNLEYSLDSLAFWLFFMAYFWFSGDQKRFTASRK
jgi:hypothetical protein